MKKILVADCIIVDIDGRCAILFGRSDKQQPELFALQATWQ